MPRQRLVLACAALLCVAASGCDAREPPRPQAWAPASLPAHQPRPVPEGSFEGTEKSLLEEYAGRKYRDAAEMASWRLPTNAKTIVVELLIAAGNDDPARVAELLTGVARWGVPDRREIHARPILTGDDPLGLEFITALRSAASRMSDKASFSCAPLQPNWSLLADSGAEPMWCSYASNDGLDLIVFRMMKEGGQLRIDYVGLFEERPAKAIYLADAGLAPPMTPYTKQPVDLTPNTSATAKPSPELETAPIRVQPPPPTAPIPVRPEPGPE